MKTCQTLIKQNTPLQVARSMSYKERGGTLERILSLEELSLTITSCLEI
jgi:hypothetical protein